MDNSLRYIGNILYFTTKKLQGEVLEQDIELCPFCFFPVTIAGKEEANFPCKFTGFCNFIVYCFPYVQIHKQ
jgi:hypothetical protein